MNNRIWTAICAATIFGLVFLTGRPGFTADDAVSEKPSVKVSAVVRKNFSTDLAALGTVNYVAKADVSSEVDGLLQSVSVEEGDLVTRGQVIAVIDPTLLQTQLNRSRAALELEEFKRPKWKNEVKKVELRVNKSRITTDNYRDLYESQKKLFKTGGISRGRLSRAEIDYQNALLEYNIAQEDLKSLKSTSKQGRLEVEARIAKARADVEGIQARLEKCWIKAPITGVVSKKKKWTGEKTPPNDAVIVTILQTDTIYADVEISEKHVGRISIGLDAEVRADAYPDRVFSGRVRAISPTIDVKSRTLQVRNRVLNEEHLLKPGMFVRVNIILDQIKDALVIPPEAIFKAGDGRQKVFVVIDGVAFLRNVQAGPRRENQVVILKGVKPGEFVVIDGQQRLEDLSSVTVEEETNTP